MDNTKGLILASVFLSAAVSFVGQVEGKKPLTYRTYLGASFMGIFLVVIGMMNERLARNFALLIILSILIRDKGHLFTFAASVGNTKQKGK